MKTSNQISGTLMSDMGSPSTKLQKTLKTLFPSGNIDLRKCSKHATCSAMSYFWNQPCPN